MKTTLIVCLFSFAFYNSVAQISNDHFFDDADRFFRSYVWDGKVNYKRIKKDRKLLDSLVQQVAVFDGSKYSKRQRRAFYCNAYQLLVTKGIIDNYPITSVKQVKGFYDERKFIVSGRKLTLNALQQLASGNDGDVNVLLTLSNGSIGGPRIYNTAFAPGKQFSVSTEQRLRSMVNDPAFVIVNKPLKLIAVSQVFNWCYPGLKLEIISVINKYRIDKADTSFTMVYMDYDWTLNDQENIQDAAFKPVEPMLVIECKSIGAGQQSSPEFISVEKIIPSIETINERIKQKMKFDTEYGFRNESRFIESKTYELRATNKFYTQTDFYNNKMLRVSSRFRTTYNQASILATYAMSNRLQGGMYYVSSKLYSEDLPARASNFFEAPADKKNHVSELQLFSKYKWYDKKYRISTLTYLSIPVIDRRKNDRIAIGSKSYDLSLQGYYDSYPTEFMRMILNAELVLHYSIAREKTTLDFNPQSRFLFPVFDFSAVKLCMVMDLLFSVNKEKVNPFTGIESIAATVKLIDPLDCNLMYQYYFMGQDAGGGHAFRFELLYRLQ